MKVAARRQFTECELDEAEQSAKILGARRSSAASASLVNRTHRVVRERAGRLQIQRNKVRSLWIPLGVSASLLAVLVFAIWTAFEEYEASPAGLPDSSQMLVLIMWSMPISVMLMAVVWFRRTGSGTESERAR